MIMTTKWSNSVAFCFNCHRGDCLATLSSEIIWKTGGALLGDEVEGGGRRKPCKNCIEEIRSHVLMTLWCCHMSWGWSTSLERETNKNKTAIRQGHHHCKIQQWKCLTRLRVMCNKVASIITVLSWYVGVYVIFEYQSKDSLPTCPEVHLGGPVRCRNGQDRSWSKFDCGSLVGKMLWFLWRESWVVEALRREFYHNLSSEDSKGLLGGFNRRIKGTFRDFWVSSTILSLVPMLVSFLYCKCVFNCRNDSDYSGSNVLVRASISPIIPSKIRFTTPLFSLISLWYKPVELSLPPEASSFFMTSFYFLFLAALDGRGLLRFFLLLRCWLLSDELGRNDFDWLGASVSEWTVAWRSWGLFLCSWWPLVENVEVGLSLALIPPAAPHISDSNKETAVSTDDNSAANHRVGTDVTLAAILTPLSLVYCQSWTRVGHRFSGWWSIRIKSCTWRNVACRRRRGRWWGRVGVCLRYWLRFGAWRWNRITWSSKTSWKRIFSGWRWGEEEDWRDGRS